MVSKEKNPLLCEGRIEKSVPRDHRLSSLGKPCDAKRRSSGRIFLSYPHTHDRFLYAVPEDCFVLANSADPDHHRNATLCRISSGSSLLATVCLLVSRI